MMASLGRDGRGASEQDFWSAGNALFDLGFGCGCAQSAKNHIVLHLGYVHSLVLYFNKKFKY